MSVVSGIPESLTRLDFTCDTIDDAMGQLSEVVGDYNPEAQKLTKAELLWLESVGKWLLMIFLPAIL